VWIVCASRVNTVPLFSVRLKGQYHEIFVTLYFSLNGTSGCPDSWAKEVLNIDSNSRRNSIRYDYENRLRALPRRAESIFLLDNAKLKFFYCHKAGKMTYDWFFYILYFCKGRKIFSPLRTMSKKLRARHSVESRLHAMPHSGESQLHEFLCEFNHMQKYFNPLISDPSGIDSCKTEIRKSRETVPLIWPYKYFFFISFRWRNS
jgi:hypothetical protein